MGPFFLQLTYIELIAVDYCEVQYIRDETRYERDLELKRVSDCITMSYMIPRDLRSLNLSVVSR